MRIVMNVLPGGFFLDYPGPPGPGRRTIISEELELVSIDGNAQPAHTPGGTQNAIVTAVRELTPNDKYFPDDDGNLLYLYEATYLFDAATDILPTALQRGLLTVNGAFRSPRQPEVKFAITGGTGPYALARGQVIESGPNGSIRTFDITL